MLAESTQRFERGLIVEAAGPFRLFIRLVPDEGCLRHEHVGTRIHGVPVPKFLGPSVSGLVCPGEDEESWTLKVRIFHVWFGTICSYEGAMRAE